MGFKWGAEGAIEKLVVYKGARYLAVISNIGHYRCNPPRVTLGLKIGYPKSSLFRLDCLVTPLLSASFPNLLQPSGTLCEMFPLYHHIFPFKIAIKSFYHQFHSFSNNFGMRSAPRPDWTRRILPPFEGTKPWSKSPQQSPGRSGEASCKTWIIS